MSDPVSDLVALARIFGMLERDAVCCGNVTVAQCIAVQTLSSGAWDNASLASALHVTPGAVTRLLDGLENKGWIARNRALDDRRRILIGLTATGRREAKRLRTLTADSVELMLAELPKAKRKQVEESLHLLRVAAHKTRDRMKC